MNSIVDPVHLAECQSIGEILLIPGTRIERIDSVHVRDYPEFGRRGVSDVFVHVTAERDIPSDVPDAEDPLMHAAGDCWQEAWYAWPVRDETTGRIGIDAMRTI